MIVDFRAYLEGLGLPPQATDRELWLFYGRLVGKKRAKQLGMPPVVQARCPSSTMAPHIAAQQLKERVRELVHHLGMDPQDAISRVAREEPALMELFESYVATGHCTPLSTRELLGH